MSLHKPARLLPLAAAISAITLATASIAIAEDTALELAPVTIEADAEQASGPVSGYTATRSVTATKTDTPLKEVPQAITVISADQVTDQKAKNLQEVLAYSAGVRAALYGVDNRGDWFTIRGSSNSSILLDGLRLPRSGWYGSVRSEPYGFERIEVLRGPSSVVGGQNPPGGLVNLVSKRPLASAQNEIVAELGNDEHRQLSLDSTGPVAGSDTLLYRMVGVIKDSGTQIDYAKEERQFIAPSITWLPSDSTRVTAYAEYQKDESGNTNAFLPWSGSLYPILDPTSAGYLRYIPRDLFIGEPDWDSYGGTRQRVGYDIEQQIGEHWTLQHRARHDEIDGHQESMYANFWEISPNGVGFVGPNKTEINRTWYASRTDSKITSGELLMVGKFNSDRLEHTVLFGVDGMMLDDNQRTDSGAATALDVFNPVYGTFARPTLNLTPGPVIDTDQAAVLGQYQLKIDQRWSITAGLRRDKIDIDSTSGDIEAEATSGKFGVVYLAENGWAPYLSYSESFEPISGVDSNLNLFKPKRGEQVELGAKWSAESSPLSFAASVYDLRETNRPTLDPNDPDPVDAFNQTQAGEVTVRGVELEASANLNQWDLIASYTYTDAAVTKSGVANDPTRDKQLVSIPKQTASFWAVNNFSINGIDGFRAGGGVRYTSETGDGQERLMTPSNTLFDALFAFEQGSWKYALNVNNLFDDDYVATCLGRGDCWFGSRRKVIGSVHYRF